MSDLGYTFIIEKTENNYSAYVNEIPGCISTGNTPQEIEKNILDALEFHIQGLKEEGYEIPEPTFQEPQFLFIEETGEKESKVYKKESTQMNLDYPISFSTFSTTSTNTIKSNSTATIEADNENENSQNNELIS